MMQNTMKSVNIMNFARQCEPRDADTDKLLFQTTKAQLEMLLELQVPHTFLLQYDTLCDPRYVSLFCENRSELTETGLWYEIVEPLTTACGMPYESAYGWKWDWHIRPGFSMAYPPEARDRLIDEAMRKYKEVFGSYPAVVGSWLLDTRTACRLKDRYDVKCLCICRDQTNTDAYSLVGGYFNGAYYPSRNNLFTPAQTKENTLEPVWFAGADARFERALLDDLFGSATLNFAYAQIGQENSFAGSDILSPLRRQIDYLRQRGDVRFEKMSETAERFNSRFGFTTPPTVSASLKNWDSEDLQSVYYQCKNYVANLFRDGDRVFLRAFYLFDETVPEHYLTDTCESFFALYENLPLVDTAVWAEDIRADIGLTLDTQGADFAFARLSDTQAKVSWGEKSVVFTEDGIETHGVTGMTYDLMHTTAQVSAAEHEIRYAYKGANYALLTNGDVSLKGRVLTIRGENLRLIPQRSR